MSQLVDSINKLEVAERDHKHRRDIVLDSFVQLEKKVEQQLNQSKSEHDAEMAKLTRALIITNIILAVVAGLTVIF